VTGHADIAQPRNSAWRRKQARDELPERFDDLLARTYAFGDPALDGAAAGRRWDPGQLSWS
jgi:hypothetical protein